VDNKQLPRMILPPHAPRLPGHAGEPNKPLRSSVQVAGPNGEIVDVRTGKVVFRTREVRLRDDGLGEGEERLEVVADLPPPCLACRGSGRQRIGFGSRTEPCDSCGGIGTVQ